MNLIQTNLRSDSTKLIYSWLIHHLTTMTTWTSRKCFASRICVALLNFAHAKQFVTLTWERCLCADAVRLYLADCHRRFQQKKTSTSEKNDVRACTSNMSSTPTAWHVLTSDPLNSDIVVACCCILAEKLSAAGCSSEHHPARNHPSHRPLTGNLAMKQRSNRQRSGFMAISLPVAAIRVWIDFNIMHTEL